MTKKNRGIRLDVAHTIAKWFDVYIPYFRGAHRLRNSLTKIFAPRPNPPQIISTRYNFDLELTTINDNIDQEIYYRGAYEAGTLNIIEKCLGNDDIFLDIGANIGLMSLLAATKVGTRGHVHSFEPEPNTYNLLQKNIFLNSNTNISTYKMGLGVSQGTQEIYNNHEDNRGTSSFIKHLPNAVKVAEVSITTLDDFIREANIQFVKMMKIDVEGWELDVLKGGQNLLSSAAAPIICIEYNTSFPHHEDIYTFLKTVNNYQMYILASGNWHVSQLKQIHDLSLMPQTGSPNLYCFLPDHLTQIPSTIFA